MGELLVDAAHAHDEDQVDDGARERADGLRLRAERRVLEQRDRDQHPVDDDGHDEDDHQRHLPAEIRITMSAMMTSDCDSEF